MRDSSAQPAFVRNPPRFGKMKTVLAVDDSASICELVRQTLSSIGYSVLVAVNGEAAIKAAEQYDGEIHLLLTDLTLPRMTGQQIAQAVAAIRPGIKVMFMSGHHDEDERVIEATKSGAVFLQKPFSINTLRDRVHGLFGYQR